MGGWIEGILFFGVFLPIFYIHKRKLLKILRILQYFGESCWNQFLLRYGDFQKTNPQNLMTLAWGIFISPKSLCVWNLTLKKIAKKKKKKKKHRFKLDSIFVWPNIIIAKCFCIFFVGIAYQGKKDIVFRLFIIESIVASWIFLAPQVIIIGPFLYEDFWKMKFWLVLKLEISYRVIISWRILVSCRGIFLILYIFAWWNI